MMREELALWLSGAKRVIVVGVGSPVRSDDAVGLAIVGSLRGRVPGNVKLLACETALENYDSTIKRSRPTHVLIIDAADMRSSPGSSQLVDPKRTVGSTISTHALPLKLFSEYIERVTGASVRLLAIQPGNVAFGTSLTDTLQETVKESSRIISGVLNSIFNNKKAPG